MIAKATNNRIDILTKYIFSCINQIFTGDISENVILLVTYANRYVKINKFKSKWKFKREIIRIFCLDISGHHKIKIILLWVLIIVKVG